MDHRWSTMVRPNGASTGLLQVELAYRHTNRRARTDDRRRLTFDSGSQASMILHHLLEHGEVADGDAVGRTVITLAVDDWLLERLLTFDAGAEDLEDGGDGELDDEADDEGASLLALPGGRQSLTACGAEWSHASREQIENTWADGSPLVPRAARVLDRLAVARSRDLLRRILRDHVTDDARQMLAERVVEHLEHSGFEIDEADQVMRKRPPTRNHG
jgi:hypothetical protein